MLRRTVTALRLAAAMAVVSFVAAAAGEDRSVMRWEVVVNGSLEETWAAFTVKEEIEQWMVPVCEIDLRLGGTMKTNYDKNAGIGGPGTIVHHILAYEPKRMISSRFDAPENAQVAKVAEATWGVTRLEPIGPAQTRVIFTSCGWGEGEAWDAARKFFEKGNAYTFEKLKKYFEEKRAREKAEQPGGEAAEERLAKLLERFTGGEWIVDSTRPDGGVFRARSIWERGPDGKCLVARGWIGDAEGMMFHGASQIWREPGAGWRLQSIDENGAVARGAVSSPGPDEVAIEWTMTRQSGEIAPYKVAIRFEGADAYEFRVTLTPAEGAPRELVKTVFRRVAEAPETHKKLKGAAAASGGGAARGK